jgi:hypothetical protein
MTTILEERALPAQEIDPKTLKHVRAAVHDVLMSTPSWRALPADVRREVARDMVTVGAYLVDGEEGARPAAAASALDDNQTPIPTPPDVPFDPGDPASKRFGGAAAGAGTGAFTEQISKVNFPKFVADLIHGTFDAIVTSSIKQMDAYTELMKNVTKTLDEYMRDNVTPNNARDFLAQQYPDHLGVDTTGGQPKLVPKEPPEGLAMPDFMKELGLSMPVEQLDDETIEQQLVPAARQRMALDRQHLLALMVAMGINRLVVTDGNISAKVLFQLDSKDSVTRSANQTQNFSYNDTKKTGKFGWWFSPSTDEVETTNFTVATTKSESSTAELDLHSRLSGEVNVRFATQSFPLDRVADMIGVDKIGDQAVGSGRRRSTEPTSGPPPLAPPMSGLTPPGFAPPAPPGAAMPGVGGR